MTYTPGDILGEIVARARSSRPPVSLEQIANGHLPQLELMQRACEQDAAHAFVHRNILALCSRRAAKSTSIMALLATDASEHDGVQIYFGKTKPSVRLSIWSKVWKPFIKKHFHIKGIFEVQHNETSMVSTFPNGAIVAFTGTDDVAHVESYLGNKLRRAVLDECFPAGTDVGGNPIESVRVGDSVRCMDHTDGRVKTRRVVRVFRKHITDPLVRIAFAGRSVALTANHPVFVGGKGYISAEDVASGDLLCVRRRDDMDQGQSCSRDVRASMHGNPVSPESRGSDDSHPMRAVRCGLQDIPKHQGKEVVQCEVRATSPEDTIKRQDALPGSPGEDLCSHDSEQPDAQARDPFEDVGHAEVNRSQAENPRRQRQGINSGRESTVGTPGLVDPGSREDRAQPAGRVGVPDLLQVGSGGPDYEDMYRGRWSEPLRAGEESAGQEEGGVLEWTRVESVSRDESPSASGTTVYNLEVEGAHTYFANGVLVHNCQAQNPSVLDPLVDRILPPALSDTGGQLILAGTIPEVPAGKFYELWQSGEGWLKRNWSRFQNPHLGTVEHQMARLDEYLKASGRKVTDGLVRRDWFGELVFETNATAYAYFQERNQYKPVEPLALEKFLAKYDGDPQYAHIHRTLAPNDGKARNGVMAAVPFSGIEVYAAAIDPGASDRFSIEVFGWGSGTQKVQQVFEFSSERSAGLHWSQIDAIRVFIQETYAPSWWFYDAGGSKVVLDNFAGDTALPALMPAGKSGLHGQVSRVSDLLLKGWLQVMQGSALEEDFQKARWDPDARAKLQWRFASQWHPDPSESARYALGAYFDSFEPPADEKTSEQLEREAHETAIRRRNAARMGHVLDEDMDAAVAADEEELWD